MTLGTQLRHQPPKTLHQARALAHKAVQFLSKTAEVNLPAKPDGSHANLGWDAAHKGFLTQPLPGRDGDIFIAVSLSPLTLKLVSGGHMKEAFPLDMTSVKDAGRWLDSHLTNAGLNAASGIDLPYELTHDVNDISIFRSAEEAYALTALSAWFDLAHATLSTFAADNAHLDPGPSAVRCWPHHFDIATYVGLEAGDSEAAQGIGVGMSPGDESYDQPYFYINPWPQLDAEELPAPPPPGHWHSEGFVGIIATANELLTLSDIPSELPKFIDAAFAIGREKLQA